jgi:hypothetical protein
MIMEDKARRQTDKEATDFEISQTYSASTSKRFRL